MLYLRKATFDDAALLLDWANDPIVRQNSFNTHHISAKEHNAWICRVLNSSDTDIYILCDEQPVGTVRIHYEKDTAELSYSIGANYRGNGYGTTIIRFAEAEAIKNKSVKFIVAEVKFENDVSRRIFNKLCYREEVYSGYFKYIKTVESIIGFRVDANKAIATGHAMRCITYAKEAISRNAIVIFFVADSESKEFIQSRGMPAIILNTQYNCMDKEIPELIHNIKNYRITSIVIDSYYVTEKYLNTINETVKSIYIDDILKFAYPVDVLVNYNIYADVNEYEELYKGKCPQLKLGIQYAPLRDEFMNAQYEVRNHVKNVLITTGGADIYNIANRICEHLLSRKELDNIVFHIVAGSFSECDFNNERIIIHRKVKNMAILMSECDIIISAGGFTLYEACSIGVPTVSISFAKNQLNNVKCFNEKKLIRYCGDFVGDAKQTLENMTLYLIELVNDYNLRRNASMKLRAFIRDKVKYDLM